MGGGGDGSDTGWRGSIWVVPAETDYGGVTDGPSRADAT